MGVQNAGATINEGNNGESLGSSSTYQQIGSSERFEHIYVVHRVPMVDVSGPSYDTVA
jgi:hypothetical protein